MLVYVILQKLETGLLFCGIYQPYVLLVTRHTPSHAHCLTFLLCG